MNADGTNVRPVGDLRPSCKASVSPNGKRIAFCRDGVIQVVNIDGTGLTTVPNTNANDRLPDWSPDGKKLALQHYTGTSFDIQTINLDGTGRVNLTNGIPQSTEEPDWSPDGTKIVFWGGTNGYQIYTINTNGSDFRQLIDDTNVNVSPEWSPDGTKIAFARSTIGSGVSEIHVMNADGSGARSLTTNAGNPPWSPDGTKIAFVRAAEPPRSTS